MADMDVHHQNPPTIPVYSCLIDVVNNRPTATVFGPVNFLGAGCLSWRTASVVAEIERRAGRKERSDPGALYIAPLEFISKYELHVQNPELKTLVKECIQVGHTKTLYDCAQLVSSKSVLFFFFISSSDDPEERTIQGLETRGYIVSFEKERTSPKRYKTAVHAVQRNRMFLKKTLDNSKEEHFLRMCKHRNIIHLIESFEMDGATWLVFPLYMSLSTGLVLNPLTIQPHVIAISVGIAQGLDFLHSINVAHLDVKPDNIVIDGNFTAILIDFETAVCVDEGETIIGFRGTIGWVAPEVQIEYEGYNPFFADRFSCGCVFEELLLVHPGACNLRAFSKALMHVYPMDRPPFQDWIQCNISEPAITTVET